MRRNWIPAVLGLVLGALIATWSKPAFRKLAATKVVAGMVDTGFVVEVRRSLKPAEKMTYLSSNDTTVVSGSRSGDQLHFVGAGLARACASILDTTKFRDAWSSDSLFRVRNYTSYRYKCRWYSVK